jgi:hypothetical protein
MRAIARQEVHLWERKPLAPTRQREFLTPLELDAHLSLWHGQIDLSSGSLAQS